MLLFAILSVSFIACITNHKDFTCLNLIVPFFLGKENCMGTDIAESREHTQSMMIRKNAYPHHQEKSEMLFIRLAKV